MRPSNVFSWPAPSAMFSGRTASTQRSPGPTPGAGEPRTVPIVVSAATRPAATSRQVPERKLLVPTKSATNPAGGSLVELLGGRHLEDPAIAHDGDAVGGRERFLPIVRDVH